MRLYHTRPLEEVLQQGKCKGRFVRLGFLKAVIGREWPFACPRATLISSVSQLSLCSLIKRLHICFHLEADLHLTQFNWSHREPIALHYITARARSSPRLRSPEAPSLSPFPPNKLWFLNRFRSGFLEPWCYLANQPAFPPVLSGTIVEPLNQWYAHWCHHGSQGKPAIFWFQLGTNFSGSEPIYFWSKCSERFKIRCANRNGTRSVLVEKGYLCSGSSRDFFLLCFLWGGVSCPPGSFFFYLVLVGVQVRVIC